MKKLDYEFVKTGFQKKGWTLVSPEYLGNLKKLDVICPNGHSTTIIWNNFKKGQGCKVCCGNQTMSFQEVKKYFEEHQCTLLSLKYNESQEILDYICCCGNVSKIRFAEFKRGGRCKKCGLNRTSQKLRYPQELIIETCLKANCVFIESWIQGRRTRIKYVCKCGQEAETYFENFRKYPNCKKCGNKKVSGEESYAWNPNREQIKFNKKIRKKCDNLLKRIIDKINVEKYKNSKGFLGYTPEELSARIHSFDFDFSQKWHIDHIFPVNAFLEHNILDIKLINCLDNLQPLSEFDNLSKADKYDKEVFLAWIASKKTTTMDEYLSVKQDFESWISKTKLQNVEVVWFEPQINNKTLFNQHNSILTDGKIPIVVFPHEWKDRSKQWKSHVLASDGQFEDRVYARKCTVKLIEKNTIREFCREYHIQGSNNLSVIGWGLYYKDELMGIISLGRHHRNYNVLLLDRMCFKSGIQIVGGANRLFSQCVKWAKTKAIKEIVSFSDNKLSLGNIYKKLNFILDKELSPDYFYICENNVLNYCSKQSQKKSVTGCPKGLTEYQWSQQCGLRRVFDCGKKRWVFTC